MTTVYIGLGSNINHPINQIITALHALQRLPHIQLRQTSHLYQTRPVGYLEQPDFINAVAELTTTLTPDALLTQLRTLEYQQGRTRDGQLNQPRNLDLDLLLFGDYTCTSNHLTIPHPGLAERAFVIIPLAEIAPQLRLPNGIRVTELAAQFAATDPTAAQLLANYNPQNIARLLQTI